MEGILSELKSALEVVFCGSEGINRCRFLYGIGNQNAAIRWLHEFGNSDSVIDACLQLLQTESANTAILFGILKLLVQCVLQKWSHIISFYIFFCYEL